MPSSPVIDAADAVASAYGLSQQPQHHKNLELWHQEQPQPHIPDFVAQNRNARSASPPHFSLGAAAGANQRDEMRISASPPAEGSNVVPQPTLQVPSENHLTGTIVTTPTSASLYNSLQMLKDEAQDQAGTQKSDQQEPFGSMEPDDFASEPFGSMDDLSSAYLCGLDDGYGKDDLAASFESLLLPSTNADADAEPGGVFANGWESILDDPWAE